jgi:3-hydroxyisobutyrate dehydrogenase
MIAHPNPETTSIGWIGTGVMGHSMAGHLLRAGYTVHLFTRTRSRAIGLLEAGAVWCQSPSEVAAHSDITLGIVGFPDDVEKVFLGDEGVLEGSRPGTVIVDMTTSRPTLAVRIAEAAAEKSVHALDAPVSGGDVGARNATLSIMIGGDGAVAEGLAPVWEVLGKTWVYQGPAGSGQHTKMVNQTLIASGMIGVCEGLLYAFRAGLDLERVLQSVGSGAAGSWSLTNLAPRIVKGNFDPGFLVEHFIKDMGIALDEAARMNLSLPGLALARQLYVAVQAQGHGRLGTHALQLALAHLNGIDWTSRQTPAPQ